MQIFENYSLLSFNTFHINASAKYLAIIKNLDHLKDIGRHEIFHKKKKLILGGGSNILFQSDFDGLVIKNEIKGIEIVKETNDYVFVRFGAGEIWHDMVLYSLDKEWFGLENLSLIPGTMGAAPIQNIGAYGTELQDVFSELNAVDLETFHQKTFAKDDCHFGYRTSIFKTDLKKRFFITSVTLKLSKSPMVNIEYNALSDYLEENNIKEISPKNISNAVIAIRQNKLPDPNQIGNGGSFFKNPVVEKDLFLNIQNEYPTIPSFPDDEGKLKIPAAYLIQECGWKGYKKNDVGVHHQQPLVLVNYGNARGKELVNLAENIQKSVYEKFQIRLEPEVNII